MDTIFHPELIDPSAFIAANATVVGRVSVAAGASVWFGAVLRGDDEEIEVGPGSNIQDNVVVHADPGFPTRIGANVTVGHGAILHGCIIEQGALIGMNATVLNGARVGAGAIVGAGAVVAPGKQISAGVLAVGIPAKVARELDPAERQAGVESAARYQERSRRYRP